MYFSLFNAFIADFERELQKIWQRNPCHVVKAKIGNFSIHQGSFHSLKKGGLVNDEVRMMYYVYQ